MRTTEEILVKNYSIIERMLLRWRMSRKINPEKIRKEVWAVIVSLEVGEFNTENFCAWKALNGHSVISKKIYKESPSGSIHVEKGAFTISGWQLFHDDGTSRVQINLSRKEQLALDQVMYKLTIDKSTKKIEEINELRESQVNGALSAIIDVVNGD